MTRIEGAGPPCSRQTRRTAAINSSSESIVVASRDGPVWSSMGRSWSPLIAWCFQFDQVGCSDREGDNRRNHDKRAYVFGGNQAVRGHAEGKSYERE